MAERQGFEPWVRDNRTHDFQSCPSAARTPLHVFCCVTGTCIVYEKIDLCQAKK